MKTALLFPGQGSQYVGMARDLFEEFDSVRELFEKAAGKLGFDLAEVCFDGPEDKLKLTANTQPAIFIHSCAISMVLKENFVAASSAAGHSLGEYSALVAAGALDLDDALIAIARRSAAMQEDCDRTSGAMSAVIGLGYDEVASIIKSVDGIVVPANYNYPDQVVISGEKGAVEEAGNRLKEAGAKRIMPLPVSGAYHSSLMSESSEVMKKQIAELTFQNFRYPIYSNVSAEPVLDGETFRELLVRQILSPVMWYPILQNMYRDGVRRFVEIGPGKVLQGTVKRSLEYPDIEILGVDTLDSLDQYMNLYARVRP
ncbi:MAG: [acyl-carrier-protein] S-malonyltransferase [candidate division Zixibacteria bacterium RBG_16_53_22]|nr:MAG: [acyl-carrier-protein] S-malonyltransferase [candidate division Zixibacteria bacterium RBG_16_53_22]